MIDETQELNINILLTGICNLGCPECFAIDHINNVAMRKIMEEEDYKYVLDLADAEDIRFVNLIGGEPSLHPKAFEFIESALERKLTVNFSTNALWSAEFLERMKQYMSKMSFEVTFHGENKYTAEKWQQLLRVFDVLQSQDVSLGFLISNQESDYSSHLDVAANHGFDIRWSLAEPTPKVYDHPLMFDYFRSSALLDSYRNKVLRFLSDCDSVEVNTWVDLAVPRCLFKEEDLSFFRGENHDVRFKCPPFFDIGTDLQFWRCFPLSSLSSGHLRDFNSIRAAYNFLQTQFSQYDSIGAYKKCDSCEYLGNSCNGGPKVAKIKRAENK